MKFCTNCGNSLKEEAQFCPECGTAVPKQVRKEQGSGYPDSEQSTDKPSAEEKQDLHFSQENPDPEANQPESSEDWATERSEETDKPKLHTEQTEPERQGPGQHTKRSPSPPATDTSDSRQNRKEKSLFKSKTSKIVSLIVAVLAIILFGSYYTINKIYMSPDAVADRFMDAVQEKDTDKLKTFINEGQLEMDATERDVKAFLAFLDERPRTITSMSEQFEEEVKQYKSHSADAVADREDSSLAALEKDGKKWLLFDRYVVNVKPVYMEVSSTENETAVFVGGEEAGMVGSEKEKELGPFLPGMYEVKAVIDGDYGKVEEVQEVDFSDVEEAEINPNFDFSDHYVELYSDNSDAILYVNDESTKEEIGDIGYFGPVAKDDSIELHAQKEFSSGDKKSDTVKIGKDTDYASLMLDYDDLDEEQGKEKEKQEALDAIDDHYEAISDEDYETAYKLFSSDKQDKFSEENWSDGLTDTIKDDVISSEVDSINDDSVKVKIEMKSYEDDDDDVLVKEWRGSWTLVEENSKWKLDESDLDEVDSWTE